MSAEDEKPAAHNVPTRLSEERRRLRSQLGNAKNHGLTQSQVDDLRSEYRTASAAQYIQELVAAAPPLTEDQKARLRALLGGA